MQRTDLTPELAMFRDTARQFFRNEIRPHGPAWREAGIVDREAFTKAGELGLLCMWAGEQHGGAGVEDFRYEQILIEENAHHGDPGFFMTLHSRLVGPYLTHFGTPEQQARFLPGMVAGTTIVAIAMTEPDAGSDLAGIRTRAVPEGDDWILNGSKTYISNGILADLVIVVAKTHPDNPHGMTLFLVERGMEGFSRGSNLAKMGLKSQDTAELFFDDVRIPAANVLGQVDMGFRHLMQGLAEERLIATVGNLAAAERARDLAVEFVKHRQVFGKPLSKFQNTRFVLAGVDAELAVGRSHVQACVAAFNADDFDATDAARAKLWTSELNGRVVDACLQLFGGAGYMDEYEISRLYTDERVNRILAGSSEIMKELIARAILD